MMNEKQIKERINSLKKEINILEEVVGTKSEGIGRPIGSVKYSEEQIIFLKDNKNLPMTNLVLKFNERFGTNLSITTRALYNFMCREGILQYKQRGEIDRYQRQGTQKRIL